MIHKWNIIQNESTSIEQEELEKLKNPLQVWQIKTSPLHFMPHSFYTFVNKNPQQTVSCSHLQFISELCVISSHFLEVDGPWHLISTIQKTFPGSNKRVIDECHPNLKQNKTKQNNLSIRNEVRNLFFGRIMSAIVRTARHKSV